MKFGGAERVRRMVVGDEMDGSMMGNEVGEG